MIVIKDRVKQPTTNTDTFIKNSMLKHGDKYCYAKINYVSSKTKVAISCKMHGDFLQTPESHLSGSGCPKCGHEYVISLRKKTFEKFVEEAKMLHGDKYTYTKDSYLNVNTKMELYCNVCKIFIHQYPLNHLKGHGCRFCGRIAGAEKDKLSKKEFVDRSVSIHGDTYDYSSSNYTLIDEPVLIRCKKHNIDFYQTPRSHFDGNTGCKKCSNHESRGEKAIRVWLDKNHIKYEQEKTFPDLIGKRGNKFRFDFYLTDYKILIEYDGIQHFEQSSEHLTRCNCIFPFDATKERDAIKNNWAAENRYRLIRISYLDHKNISDILSRELLCHI